MEHMEARMQDHFDGMSANQSYVWKEARDKAREHLFNATANAELLPEENGNPYLIGCWMYDEWEAAYEHYIMTGLGY